MIPMETQRRREGVDLVAPLTIAVTIDPDHKSCLRNMDQAAIMTKRKQPSCVVQCAVSLECKLDGRMIDVRSFGQMDVFTRRVFLASDPVSISNLASTLP